ncbi:protein kinase [Nonomuraea sp. NPDC050404]|uniref:serine/threonine-protein kinase n=1 Tax=Nonomuraea sp. NPDC050404 TaxID=3155783 RepID=UPI0034113B1E
MSVIGEQVRGYELLARAGQDGPWTVHFARPATGGADVLVKTLSCHQVDRRALKRIIRDFGFPEELARHPGVIPVLEVGATGDGRPYLVTPRHDGLTLAERPERGRPMPVEQAMGLLWTVARLVAATHEAGGAHGGVRPANVVMTTGGVVLTGFAMSALMSIVDLPDGTLPSVHAAPEELEGNPPVPASDVYALGSMAYELLAGRPAFPLDGPGSRATFALGVLTQAPAPLPASVPPDLARIIIKAMSKDPASRPSALDLANAARPRNLHQPAPGPGQPFPSSPPGAASPSVPGPATPPPLHPQAAPPPPHPQAAPPPVPGAAPSPPHPQAGPQPYLPHPVAAPPAQAPSPAQTDGGRSKVPFLVVGLAALVGLVGMVTVALTTSGDQGTTTAAEDTRPAGRTDAPATAARPEDRPPTAGPENTATPSDRQAQPSESPARQPSTFPRSSRQTADVAAYRPRNLKVVSDKGRTVTLSWKAGRRSDYPTVIQQAPGDRLVSAAAGGSTHTMGGLDPAKGYCFKVGTVVRLGRPSSVAWSTTLCIRGAAEKNKDRDDAQPPIVLPPITPPSAEQG